MRDQAPNPTKPRLGVSACLLGDEVRYDGGHRRDDFLLSLLGPHVEWVRFCPEAESGMGTPRESIRLVKTPEGLRLRTVETDRDVTDTLDKYARKQTPRIEKLELHGFILKKNSPSCGLERVKHYSTKGIPGGSGPGRFAEHLVKSFPLLPLEEEGRLRDPALRENFVERVFAYSRLRQLNASWSAGRLVAFHTAHKYQILAHSPRHYQELGRLVAGIKKLGKGEALERYGSLFMEALGKPATPSRNINVLQHMLGYLKKELPAETNGEIRQLMEDYRKGWIPLVVPLTLIHHYVRRLDVRYLLGQTYLEPNPRELMLRNHV